MSDYTGPVKVVTFQMGADTNTRFAITLHQNGEDPRGLAPILFRYRDDGYSVIHTVDKFMENGHIVDREPRVGPAGFARRAAFLRG
jgi:hypothetical protein